jgi:hypothetical protein
MSRNALKAGNPEQTVSVYEVVFKNGISGLSLSVDDPEKLLDEIVTAWEFATTTPIDVPEPEKLIERKKCVFSSNYL